MPVVAGRLIDHPLQMLKTIYRAVRALYPSLAFTSKNE